MHLHFPAVGMPALLSRLFSRQDRRVGRVGCLQILPQIFPRCRAREESRHKSNDGYAVLDTSLITEPRHRHANHAPVAKTVQAPKTLCTSSCVTSRPKSARTSYAGCNILSIIGLNGRIGTQQIHILTALLDLGRGCTASRRRVRPALPRCGAQVPR